MFVPDPRDAPRAKAISLAINWIRFCWSFRICHDIMTAFFSVMAALIQLWVFLNRLISQCNYYPPLHFVGKSGHTPWSPQPLSRMRRRNWKDSVAYSHCWTLTSIFHHHCLIWVWKITIMIISNLINAWSRSWVLHIPRLDPICPFGVDIYIYIISPSNSQPPGWHHGRSTCTQLNLLKWRRWTVRWVLDSRWVHYMIYMHACMHAYIYIYCIFVCMIWL